MSLANFQTNRHREAPVNRRAISTTTHSLIPFSADASMERLSPVGADAKSLRRETKRGYEVAVATGMVKIENMESPMKKTMPEKPKSKSAASGSGGSSAAAKKKAMRHQQVAQLQGVVDGIQQQVDAASKGIQELKELVHAHLVGHSMTTEPEPYMGACVSPPASLMTVAQDDCIFEEFPAHPDALIYYGGEPMPFSC